MQLYTAKALKQFTTYETGPQTHTHARTHKYPKNDRTNWSLLRPHSDLPASCGVQGPGPRGQTGPLARSGGSKLAKPAGRRLAGEDPPSTDASQNLCATRTVGERRANAQKNNAENDRGTTLTRTRTTGEPLN